MKRVAKPFYVLAFGVLTFAVRNLIDPARIALLMAAGAVVYGCLVAVTARVIDRVERAPRLWHAALMLVAGTGLATFLFPLPRLAIVFGLIFCALDVARRWQPDAVTLPAERA